MKKLYQNGEIGLDLSKVLAFWIERRPSEMNHPDSVMSTYYRDLIILIGIPGFEPLKKSFVYKTVSHEKFWDRPEKRQEHFNEEIVEMHKDLIEYFNK